MRLVIEIPSTYLFGLIAYAAALVITWVTAWLVCRSHKRQHWTRK